MHGYVDDQVAIWALYQHFFVFCAAAHHSFMGINIARYLNSLSIEQYRHIAVVIPNLLFCPEQINLGNFADMIFTQHLLPAGDDNPHTRQKYQVVWKCINSLTA